VDGALVINRITSYVRTSAVHGGIDWSRASGVEEHDRVGGVGGDNVGEAPGERVHALLARQLLQQWKERRFRERIS
jgi:hypothetical protein